MTQAFDVCIRGAGIVGQTLALLLARERLRVALVGPVQVPEAPANDVRAYALNAASRALIESVRAWPPVHQATAVRTMRIENAGGAQVEFSADALAVPALTWIVDVPALESLLSQAVGFQPLIERVSAPQSATLTVVCEGKSSESRAEFGVDFPAKPYFQTAIATRIACARPHGQVAWQWIAGGEILAFLPLDGEQGNSMAVVWSVATERARDLLALPAQEFAQQLQAASHDALGSVSVSCERSAWPLVSAQAQRWVGQLPGGAAWALAGDAAHAVHPLAGQGLNLGLADVAELVRVLHQREYWRSVSDQKLLRRYERARAGALRVMGSAMDGLQQMLTREDAPVQALRSWGMRGFDSSGPIKRWVAQRAMGLV
jgi:2-polyprenyl-6-methoxyphenol hydroxylase-like FAD-dependent oxidoreductase